MITYLGGLTNGRVPNEKLFVGRNHKEPLTLQYHRIWRDMSLVRYCDTAMTFHTQRVDLITKMGFQSHNNPLAKRYLERG